MYIVYISLSIYIYMCMYIYIYTHIYIHIYIYIYREREMYIIQHSKPNPRTLVSLSFCQLISASCPRTLSDTNITHTHIY